MSKYDYTKCCTHYKTDKYSDGYVMFSPFKIKVCENCGETHLVCNWFLQVLFAYFLSWFWDGTIWVEEEEDNV